MRKNILINISFDGKNYHGWQIQKNALTVQEVFQESLKKVLKHVPEIKGCSRTDTGVHANNYFISSKIDSKISIKRLKLAVNRYLPVDIVVKDCFEVSDNFHARYSCIGKEYVYKIWNDKIRNPFLSKHALFYWNNLEVDFLNKAAKIFIGKRNFKSFCTVDKRNSENMIRKVEYFDVYKEKNNIVIFRVKADGFLYNMVRIMVGTLLKINKNKNINLEEILNSQNRKLSGPTAPACGLYLNKLFYEEF
ncbi:MAG: tRNA pseudouridine(38-40) synthase TruA [Candidatus Paraimprobicoccus trichonymphae]|uniref:tRNA pseudouridine synthase A n=1 Tax=Candidatus Paraimprobicoccus trichonymphae TaxID=3033793 RepID=A0AA48L1I3_9FIRM|nr:MAG: tRNA pseudouridine(38-40) synthase TruA [Candidatus Paraimprobicoccus trichonymphae]